MTTLITFEMQGVKAAASLVCRVRFVGRPHLRSTYPIIMTQDVEVSTHQQFLTVDQAVESIKAAATSLRTASAHPTHSSQLVVKRSDVEQIVIHLARLESRQKDMLESERVDEVCQLESQQGREAALVANRIVTTHQRGKATPEDLYALLDKSPRPDVTRRLVTAASRTELVDDAGVVVDAAASRGPITLQIPTPCTVRVRIVALHRDECADLLMVDSCGNGVIERWLQKPCQLRFQQEDRVWMALGYLGELDIQMSVQATITWRSDAKSTDQLDLNLLAVLNVEAIQLAARTPLLSATASLLKDNPAQAAP